MKTFVLIIFLIGASLTYAANNNTADNNQPQLYKIDVLIFKNLPGLQSIGSNQWQPFQNQNFKNVISLKQESINNSYEPFSALPSNQFILNIAAKHIQHSSLYQFITQRCWIQPALDESKTETVLINGGLKYSGFQENPIWELTGTISLSSSLYQYLNLSVNFFLTEPNNTSSNNTIFRSLELKEQRRILVNQLNYLDSPGFGILVKVVKLGSQTI